MRTIFLNLPVKNLETTVNFFEELGFKFKPEFTNETATAMIIRENTFVMFFTESQFQTLTQKNLINRDKEIGHIFSISVDSKQEVDKMVEKALSLGGSKASNQTDYGFVYQYSFCDINGYTWEIFWMDENQMN